MRISDWSSDVCSSDLRDRREELLVIAAREVGAADRALEQYVADDRELRWLVVKDDMPRRVPRTVDDVEGQRADRHRVAVVQPAVRLERLAAHPEACAVLAAPPHPKAVGPARSLDRPPALLPRHPPPPPPPH